MSDTGGLFKKYHITKTDGSEIDPDAIYFVLRLDTDMAARAAILQYAKQCRNHVLVRDILALVDKLNSEEV